MASQRCVGSAGGRAVCGCRRRDALPLPPLAACDGIDTCSSRRGSAHTGGAQQPLREPMAAAAVGCAVAAVGSRAPALAVAVTWHSDTTPRTPSRPVCDLQPIAMQSSTSLLAKAAAGLAKGPPLLPLGASAALLSAHRWAGSVSGPGAGSSSGQAGSGTPGAGAGRPAAPGAAAAEEELGDLRPGGRCRQHSALCSSLAPRAVARSLGGSAALAGLALPAGGVSAP